MGNEKVSSTCGRGEGADGAITDRVAPRSGWGERAASNGLLLRLERPSSTSKGRRRGDRRERWEVRKSAQGRGEGGQGDTGGSRWQEEEEEEEELTVNRRAYILTVCMLLQWRLLDLLLK